jgi:hypothetical protein
VLRPKVPYASRRINYQKINHHLSSDAAWRAGVLFSAAYAQIKTHCVIFIQICLRKRIVQIIERGIGHRRARIKNLMLLAAFGARARNFLSVSSE